MILHFFYYKVPIARPGLLTLSQKIVFSYLFFPLLSFFLEYLPAPRHWLQGVNPPPFQACGVQDK